MPVGHDIVGFLTIFVHRKCDITILIGLQVFFKEKTHFLVLFTNKVLRKTKKVKIFKNVGLFLGVTIKYNKKN